ncbi:MAG: catalase family peroxidase, partial [Actinomycetota bacterium]|nr:catalase family peroxidase [Actinomycetota bacterium]
MTITPDQAIDAANEVFGRHTGHRALHAKGTLLTGTFTATPAGTRLTRAAHMQGAPVRVTARVSNAAGDPHARDYVPVIRGLAVKCYLPDGSRTDVVAQSAPRFPARTPEAFVELMRATAPSASMPLRLARFLARNPVGIGGLPANARALLPPASYATIPYYAIHAYRWVDSGGTSRYVRYTLVPHVTEPPLAPWQARSRGCDYLRQEIRDRVARGPVRFKLEVQIADPGDRVDDPTSVWPRQRETVIAGTLELTGLDTERETGNDVLVFDPVRVTDGIELPDDPILRF